MRVWVTRGWVYESMGYERVNYESKCMGYEREGELREIYKRVCYVTRFTSEHIVLSIS